MRYILGFLVVLIANFVNFSEAYGEYRTNKFALKSEIETGGWVVAWADDMSETDAIQGVVAAGVSVYTANPAPFIEWVRQLVDRTISSLTASARERFSQELRSQAERFTREAIEAAIRGRNANEVLRQFDTVDFKAGAIKYSGGNYLGNQIISRTWGLKPYVAFRVKDPVGAPSPPQALLQSGTTVHLRTRVRYYLNAPGGDGFANRGPEGIARVVNRAHPDPTVSDEIWWIEKVSGSGPIHHGDAVHLRTRVPYYLNAPGGDGFSNNGPEGIARVVNRAHPDPIVSDEIWWIEKVSGNGPIHRGDTVHLRTRSRYYLNAPGGDGFAHGSPAGVVRVVNRVHPDPAVSDEIWWIE